MRILLNATDALLSVRAVRRYVTEMIHGLGNTTSGVDLHLVFFTHHGLQVKRFVDGLPEHVEATVHWKPVPRRILNKRHKRPRRELRKLAREVDLYHETTIDSPDFEDLPVVATIHGLCPLVAPGLLPADFAEDKQAAYERTLAMSGYFAAVSETTRNEFLDLFPVDPDRVRAIPLGVSTNFVPAGPERTAPILSAMGIESPYLLYSGGIQPNKNIPRVLRTFARLRREGVFDGRLVLVGDNHYTPDQLESLLETEGIEGEVDFPGFFAPDDSRLPALYAGAELFLFPSLYEGWTSPPLEAMACGTPVLASNASSIPETVGDAAVLCAPQDENAWVLEATRILTSPGVRDDLRAKGIDRASQFPWSRTVVKTVAFYESILQKTPSPKEIRSKT